MVTIYVDARCLQDTNYSNRGVGRFSKNVLKGLKETRTEKIVLKAIIDLEFDDLLIDFKDFFDEIVVAKAQALKDCDIFLSLSPMTHSNKEFAKILANKDIYHVCLFYDLIPYQFPEIFLSNKIDKLLYEISLYYLQFYDLFLSISDDSRNKLCEYTNIDPAKCVTVGASINDYFLNYKNNRKIKHKKIAFSRKKYFITVGGCCNRKNSIFALQAFGEYIEKYKSDFGLVIIDPSPRHKKQYEDMARKYNIHKQLQILGNITDEELASALSEALANICPSKAEGFFLPLVEGFACGTISISSECKAQCELIEHNKDIIFSLKNTKDLVRLLRKIETDSDFVTSIKAKYSYVPRKFSVAEVNKRINEYIFDGFKKFKNKNKKIAKTNFSKKKLKIAFITPYPPDQSGCADYSYATLKNLCKKANVDIYTDAHTPTNDVGANSISKISPYPYLSKKYDHVISVIGNSDFHKKIIKYNLNYGESCILHDARNLHLYLSMYGINKLEKIITLKTNKNVTAKEIQKWARNDDLIKYFFLDDNIRSSKFAFIHSKETIKLLKKYKLNNIYYLPFCIYDNLLTKHVSKVSLQKLKRRYNFTENNIIISSFGFPAETKAIEKIIEAVACLIKHGYTNIKFCLVGKFTIGALYHRALFDLVKKCKLEKHFVFFEDFLPKDVYNDYMFITDIAVQLRTYKIGGLSGALLDCIASGTYTISNNYLKNLLDSPSYVKGISDKIDVGELYNTLKSIIDSKTYLKPNKSERDKYANRYNFNVYVKELLKALKQDKAP